LDGDGVGPVSAGVGDCVGPVSAGVEATVGESVNFDFFELFAFFGPLFALLFFFLEFVGLAVPLGGDVLSPLFFFDFLLSFDFFNLLTLVVLTAPVAAKFSSKIEAFATDANKKATRIVNLNIILAKN